jgi:hypothetical protein
MSWPQIRSRWEARKASPIVERSHHDLLDLYFPFLTSEINKACTATQVTPIAEAKQNSRDLNSSRDRDRLIVKGQGQFGCKFRSESPRKPTATQQCDGLPRDGPDDIMQPLFAL